MDTELALRLLGARYGGSMHLATMTPTTFSVLIPKWEKAVAATMQELNKEHFATALDRNSKDDYWLLTVTEAYYRKPDVSYAISILQDEIAGTDSSTLVSGLKQAVELLRRYGRYD